MKKSEFIKLIREEVRTVLSEATSKAIVLVVEEDGKFVMQPLKTYTKKASLNVNKPYHKVPSNKVSNYAMATNAWSKSPDLAKSENAKWKQAVAKIGSNFDFYDVTGKNDDGQKAAIAIVPIGSKPDDHAVQWW